MYYWHGYCYGLRLVMAWPALTIVVRPRPALTIVVRPRPALTIVVRPRPALTIVVSHDGIAFRADAGTARPPPASPSEFTSGNIAIHMTYT
jgi:hypothetical protein